MAPLPNPSQRPHRRRQRPTKPTLLIGLPQADAGFDTARIIYVRAGDRREYFAQSQWIDTPARMLSPLLVATLGASGRFRAVVAEPSTAATDLRLDTRIVRFAAGLHQHAEPGCASRCART